MSGNLLERYQRFTAAAMAGNRAGAQSYIDPERFSATLPGQRRLNFNEYMKLLAQLREIAPDFGQHFRPAKAVTEGSTVVMRYHMAYTLDGITPTYVEYTGMDMVTFDNEGRIVELFVTYDRASTREQAFGAQLNLPTDF